MSSSVGAVRGRLARSRASAGRALVDNEWQAPLYLTQYSVTAAVSRHAPVQASIDDTRHTELNNNSSNISRYN